MLSSIVTLFVKHVTEPTQSTPSMPVHQNLAMGTSTYFYVCLPAALSVPWVCVLSFVEFRTDVVLFQILSHQEERRQSWHGAIRQTLLETPAKSTIQGVQINVYTYILWKKYASGLYFIKDKNILKSDLETIRLKKKIYVSKLVTDWKTWPKCICLFFFVVAFLLFFCCCFFFCTADVSNLSRSQLCSVWNMTLHFWMNKIQDRTRRWWSLLFKVFYCVCHVFSSNFDKLVHKKLKKKLSKQKN